jgi:hypothetical protein
MLAILHQGIEFMTPQDHQVTPIVARYLTLTLNAGGYFLILRRS